MQETWAAPGNIRGATHAKFVGWLCARCVGPHDNSRSRSPGGQPVIRRQDFPKAREEGSVRWQRPFVP